MRKKIRVVLETNAKEEKPLRPCGTYDGGVTKQPSHLGNESGLADSRNLEVSISSGNVDKKHNPQVGSPQNATTHRAPSCDSGGGEAQEGSDESGVARDKLLIKHIIKVK
jgi:hypothetical protein